MTTIDMVTAFDAQDFSGVNGMTVGQQKFEAETLNELLNQIRAFLNNFSNKR